MTELISDVYEDEETEEVLAAPAVEKEDDEEIIFITKH